MVPLVEREPVRRAAVALVKALMREVGVKPADLLDGKPPEKIYKGLQPGPSTTASLAPRQLVRPAATKPPRVHKPPAWGASPAAPIPAVVAPKIGLKADAEVIVPPGVKVTRCPSGRDTRYTVEGPVVGEFTRDWLQRRKGGKR